MNEQIEAEDGRRQRDWRTRWPLGAALIAASLGASVSPAIAAGDPPAGVLPIRYDVDPAVTEAAPAEPAAALPVDAPPTTLAPDRAPDRAPDDAGRYESFGERVGAVKWEFAAFAAGFAIVHIPPVVKDPQPFHFKTEGLFGRNTNNVGIDKLSHAHNTYVISELLYHRIARKAGEGLPSALTAATLAVGLQAFGEVTDGLKSSGFSLTDFGFNLAGGGFSVLRHTVPGLQDKLDFRLSVYPNDHVYTFQGKEHYEQQRYLMAVKLAGFGELRRTPLRLLELHLGYYGKDFRREDRARGVIPQRTVFAGFGINFGELLFRNSRSTFGRAARSVVQYYQLPHTTLRVK